MDADGSDRRALPGASLIERLSGNADGEEPAVSPDGERIAFAATAGKDNEEIYTVRIDGSRRTRLTDIPGNDHWPPTWSPDSTRIAFTSDGTKDNAEIYVVNSNGSGLTKLTDNPAYDAFPAWRPRVK
jgi:Tol biopolymer transport system component